MNAAERLDQLRATRRELDQLNERLRRETVAAVGQGIPVARVAAAAGVARATVDRWTTP
jgi:DNA-directed RNA polymerase specialized sigma24 family protein